MNSSRIVIDAATQDVVFVLRKRSSRSGAYQAH